MHLGLGFTTPIELRLALRFPLCLSLQLSVCLRFALVVRGLFDRCRCLRLVPPTARRTLCQSRPDRARGPR